MRTLKWTALLVGMAGALAHGGETRQKLTVYLRFGPTNRYTVRFLTQDVAARMFADIGIYLEWKTWQSATESLQLSIVMELVSATPENLSPRPPAYSLLREGIYTRVFLDRIIKMKYSAYALAYVMAGEITHIVDGVVRRAETEVMQAHWSVQDYCEMRLRQLTFAPKDVRLIYDGLSARRAISTQDVTR